MKKQILVYVALYTSSVMLSIPVHANVEGTNPAAPAAAATDTAATPQLEITPGQAATEQPQAVVEGTQSAAVEQASANANNALPSEAGAEQAAPVKQVEHLTLFGEGQAPDDHDLILVRRHGKDLMLYSFKYCTDSVSTEADAKTGEKVAQIQTEGKVQKLRRELLDDAENPDNENKMAALFDDSACTVLTKNSIYKIKFEKTEDNSSLVEQQIAHLDQRIWFPKVALPIGFVAGLGMAVASFSSFSHRNATLGLFTKLKRSTIPQVMVALAFLGSSAWFYKWRDDGDKERRTLYAFYRLMERSGHILQIDGSMKDMKKALEIGLQRAIGKTIVAY